MVAERIEKGGLVREVVGGVTVLYPSFQEVVIWKLSLLRCDCCSQSPPRPLPSVDEKQRPDNLGRSPQQHAWLVLACAGPGDCVSS